MSYVSYGRTGCRRDKLHSKKQSNTKGMMLLIEILSQDECHFDICLCKIENNPEDRLRLLVPFWNNTRV